MQLKNNLSLFVLLLFCVQVYPQADILDFIIKENDTLYGTLRPNGTKKLWFYQRINLDNGKFEISEEKLSKKIKTIRRDGKIYHLINGKYKTRIPVLPDYVVTTGNDTIFGEIKTPKLFGKKYLLNEKGRKYHIKPSLVSSYRMDNFTYDYLEENPERNIAQKGNYFRLLQDGKVALYIFKSKSSGNHLRLDFSGVYIRKGKEFQRVYNSRFPLIARDLFGDNVELIQRIKEKEFTAENIYLVTRIYNRYLENKSF